MINIQKSYSVHSIFFSPIWSYLVHMDLFSPFSPLKFDSVLFSPFRSYSVHIGSIWSTLALFGPPQSYFVHIGPIRSILSIVVLLGRFVHFGSISFILFTSILFSLHWFNLDHFIPICPIRSNLVPFGPLCLL